MHPLLRPVAEGAHQLSAEGERRAEADAELAPGHDCCALCASGAETNKAFLCRGCSAVRYCSKNHRTEDAPAHAAVCEHLRWMAARDRLLDEQEAATGPGSSTPAAGGTSSSGRQRQQQQQQQQQQGRRRDGGDGAFAERLGLEHGWQHVMPRCFQLVLPAEGAAAPGGGGDAGAELASTPAVGAETRPAKKKRTTAGDQGDDGTLTGPPAAPAAGADAQLALATRLASRTSALTYAFTAAYMLQRYAPARSAVAAAAAAGRPVELVVLGAAGDAELADLASWQVVANTLDADVRCRFVGPEVPDALDGTEQQRGRVSMRFEQRSYMPAARGAAGGSGASGGGAATPDVFLAFNPGFTCPDYEWDETLVALAAACSCGGGRSSAGPQRPRPCLLLSTNTRMEALMEGELLELAGWSAQAEAEANPYTSLYALQSGTLASDLYRKNAWVGCYVREPKVEATAKPSRGQGAKGKKHGQQQRRHKGKKGHFKGSR